MATQFDPSLREVEAAFALGLAPNTLAQMRVKGGGPPYIKIGKAVRYPQNELLAWRDSRMRTSTSDNRAIAAP